VVVANTPEVVMSHSHWLTGHDLPTTCQSCCLSVITVHHILVDCTYQQTLTLGIFKVSSLWIFLIALTIHFIKEIHSY